MEFQMQRETTRAKYTSGAKKTRLALAEANPGEAGTKQALRKEAKLEEAGGAKVSQAAAGEAKVSQAAAGAVKASQAAAGASQAGAAKDSEDSIINSI